MEIYFKKYIMSYDWKPQNIYQMDIEVGIFFFKCINMMSTVTWFEVF